MKSVKKLFNSIFLLSLLIILSAVFPEDLLARRGGGFRMSRSSGWGSSRSLSKSAFSSKSRKMRSNRSSSSRKLGRGGKSDQKLYNKAKANGTAFRTRDAAKSSFQQKHGKQYGSSYKQKPAKRPEHIPQNTSVNGRQYPVSYNRGYGGYGYMGPGGGWVAYSVMRDMMMMSMLMDRHNYYYGDAPGEGGYRKRRSSGLGMFVFFGIIAFAIFMRPRF